jgi:hypothetical protein
MAQLCASKKAKELKKSAQNGPTICEEFLKSSSMRKLLQAIPIVEASVGNIQN